MKIKLLIICTFLFLLTACEQMAMLTTPKKKAVPSTSSLAASAETNFWQALHTGTYADISRVDSLLTAAYLENPNDSKLATHLGFLHIWKITERHRERIVPPTITNEIILARKYFVDSVELDPNDARYLGFLGDSQLVEGQIFHDARLQTQGYFTLKRAIKAWPEFNYFSAGYPMSALSSQSSYFKEGLDWQWHTLDLCAGEKIDRNNPDYSKYMPNETLKGPKRACWNSWIAPYNFEGFFMNMGDMLVKSGDPETAIKIYQNAKLDKHYITWPYRQQLEDRMIHARENVSNFQKEFAGKNNTIMFNAGYGCAACHEG